MDGYILGKEYFDSLNGMVDKTDVKYILEYRSEMLDNLVNKELSYETIMQLQSILKELNSKVIVRSSSVHEDMSTYSAAGVFYSSAKIDDLNQLVNEIKNCYKSLYNQIHLDRMQEYGMSDEELFMPVLICEYCEYDIIGTAFTYDNTRYTDRYINISIKDKEEYVLYTYDKSDKMIITDTDSKYDEECIDYIAKTLIQLEEEFGYYVDVEFALINNEIIIFQVRPMTACKKLDNIIEEMKSKGYCVFDNQAQTPLSIDMHLKSMDFYNTAIKEGPTLFPETIEIKIKRSKIFFKTKFDIDAKCKLDSYMDYSKTLAEEYKNIFYDTILPKLIKDIEFWNNVNFSDCSRVELVGLLDKALDYWKVCHRYQLEAEFASLYINKDISLEWNFYNKYKKQFDSFKDHQIFALLYSGTKNTQERYALIDLAKIVYEDEFLLNCFNDIKSDYCLYKYIFNNCKTPSHFKSKFNKYLKEFQFTLTEDWKICRQKSINSNLHYVLRKIRNLINDNIYIILDNRDQLFEQQNDVSLAMNKAIDEDGRKIFQKDLQYARKAFQAKDDHAYYLEKMPLMIINVVLDELSIRLKKEGYISNNCQVEFITLDEIRHIKSLEDISEIINERMVRYNEDINTLTKQVEHEFSDTEECVETYELTGISNMGLITEGIAVNGIQNMNEHDNSILVLESDKYEVEDILPYLVNTKAVLMRRGDPLGHFSICCRELSVVAIYNIDVNNIEDGDKVYINGCTGSVRIEKKKCLLQ